MMDAPVNTFTLNAILHLEAKGYTILTPADKERLIQLSKKERWGKFNLEELSRRSAFCCEKAAEDIPVLLAEIVNFGHEQTEEQDNVK
jgi:hypothetical protein